MDDLFSARLSNYYKYLTFIMGVCITFGENLNEYIPYASQAYVVIGVFFAISVIISEWVLRRRNVLRFYSGTYKVWFCLIIYLLTLLIVRFFIIGERYTEDEGILDYFRTVIFLVIGLALFSILKEDINMLNVFIKGIVTGFFFALPFGSFKAYYGSERFLGTYNNPNVLALDCCIVIFCLFFLLANKKMILLKVSLGVIVLLILVLTGTRGAILGVLVPVFFYVLKNVKAEYKVLLPILGILLLLMLLVYVKLADSSILNRFLSDGDAGTSDAADLRLTIWFSYLKNIKRYFLFGMKISDLQLVSTKTPHNTYLGVFVRYGFFTFILYMGIVIAMIKKALKYIFDKEESGYSKALGCMLLGVLICGFFTENLFSRATYAVWAVFLAKDYYNNNLSIGIEGM